MANLNIPKLKIISEHEGSKINIYIMSHIEKYIYNVYQNIETDIVADETDALMIRYLKEIEKIKSPERLEKRIMKIAKNIYDTILIIHPPYKQNIQQITLISEVMIKKATKMWLEVFFKQYIQTTKNSKNLNKINEEKLKILEDIFGKDSFELLSQKSTIERRVYMTENWEKIESAILKINTSSVANYLEISKQELVDFIRYNKPVFYMENNINSVDFPSEVVDNVYKLLSEGYSLTDVINYYKQHNIEMSIWSIWRNLKLKYPEANKEWYRDIQHKKEAELFDKAKVILGEEFLKEIKACHGKGFRDVFRRHIDALKKALLVSSSNVVGNILGQSPQNISSFFNTYDSNWWKDIYMYRKEIPESKE